MTLSRRELLTLLLGAPLAAQACKRRPPPGYPGTIRGGALEVGHRLREGDIGKPNGPPRRVSVAIVGAGPSGLSAAWELERAGVTDFVVYDLENQPGGTSAFGSDGVVPYPWAAHYLPLPSASNRDLLALLAEMRVIELDDGRPVPLPGTLVREPEERVFYDEAWHEGLLPWGRLGEADREQLARFEAKVAEWVSFRDGAGRRAFTLPRRECSTDPRVTALDRISAARWLDDQELRSPFVRWYVAYACRDDYGCTLETTSAWAMLFYFASRVEDPLASSAPFLVWPEGNGRLVSHFAKVLGSRLELGRLVFDVEPTSKGTELHVLHAASNDTERVLADHVILAVPKHVARYVFSPWRKQPPGFLEAFTYGVWMTANLHLSRRPRSVGFPFAWDNVLFESESLGYVVATHQTLRDHGPTIWTYYLPLVDEPTVARVKLEAQDHRSACDAIVADLSRAHLNLESCIERIDVWRWGHAMIRPVPGFLWSAARAEAARAVGNVHFAHSDLSGLPLFEEAFDQGLRAAREVVRRQRSVR